MDGFPRTNPDFLCPISPPSCLSAAEVSYWVHVFVNCMSNETEVAGFVGPQKAFQPQGTDNVRDWIFVAHQEILHRQPQASEAANWIGALGGQDQGGTVLERPSAVKCLYDDLG